jgi:hypothetical protein
MTYVEAVNSVLRRLRESTVDTVQGSGNSNSYARLIGDFVNEAKSQAEVAWKWGGLRQTLSGNTTAGAFNYEIQGSSNNFEVLDAWDATSRRELQYQTSSWFNKAYMIENPPTGSPQYYTFNGVSDDGDTLVDVYPIPDGVYVTRFNVVLRNQVLTQDSDRIYIPTRTIILLATAMAIEERGEDGGQQSINAYKSAEVALADEIAMDANRHPEEVVWYTV